MDEFILFMREHPFLKQYYMYLPFSLLVISRKWLHYFSKIQSVNKINDRLFVYSRLRLKLPKWGLLEIEYT